MNVDQYLTKCRNEWENTVTPYQLPTSSQFAFDLPSSEIALSMTTPSENEAIQGLLELAIRDDLGHVCGTEGEHHEIRVQ